MQFFLIISKGIDWFTTKVGQLMWWVALAMVLIGAWNVIGRYGYDLIASIFGHDFARAMSGNRYLSLQTFFYNMIFLLGAAYVLKSDGHVRVDILYSTFKARTKALVDIAGTVFFLFPLCYFLLAYSYPNISASWARLEASSDPGGIPLYIVKTVFPIGIALISLQGISEIIKNVAFLRGHPESGSIHSIEKDPIKELIQQVESA